MAIIEILQQHAFLSILGISAALALFSTLVYKYATDQALMKAIKEEMKKLQDEMKANKDNPQKIAELQGKLMPLNTKMMSQSFKPMILTIVPFLVIFALLGKVYNGLIIIPMSFWQCTNKITHLPYMCHLGWVGTYVILSMIFTTILRKALKVV
jgi:uncharacterized membrane protein (DUF106 family)